MAATEKIHSNGYKAHIVNGHIVIHYLAFGETYPQAIDNAKPYGGVKVHNKDFGGGIGFRDLQDAKDAMKVFHG